MEFLIHALSILLQKAIFLVLLITPLSLIALYNGNPDYPEMPEEGLFISKESWLSFKLGYEGDMVFDRKMKASLHGDQFHHRVRTFETIMNGASATFGFVARAEIYFVASLYQAKMSHDPISGTHIRYVSDHHLAWTGGARAIVAYWGETKLGIDAKYFLSFPQIDSIHVNGNRISHQGDVFDREWQVGIGVSHRVSFFVPYFGINYTNVKIKFRHLYSLSSIFPDHHFTMRNENKIGLFFGFGLSPDRGYAFNLEARIFEETAATAAFDISF